MPLHFGLFDKAKHYARISIFGNCNTNPNFNDNSYIGINNCAYNTKPLKSPYNFSTKNKHKDLNYYNIKRKYKVKDPYWNKSNTEINQRSNKLVNIKENVDQRINNFHSSHQINQQDERFDTNNIQLKRNGLCKRHFRNKQLVKNIAKI